MILTIDVGNTNTGVALFSTPPAAGGGGAVVGEDLAPAAVPAAADVVPTPVRFWRIRTSWRVTADELAMTIRGLLREHADEVAGVVAQSVVPSVLAELRTMLPRYWGQVPSVVFEPGVKAGVALLMDSPRDTGTDRVVNALAAHKRIGAGCIVVDFVTATTIDVVSAAGALIGGVICPGIEISMDALATRAAALRSVEPLAPPKVIGKNTVTALQSGAVYGFAGQVEAIIARIRAENPEFGSCPVLATGWLAPVVIQHCDSVDQYCPYLTAEGLWWVLRRAHGEIE